MIMQEPPSDDFLEVGNSGAQIDYSNNDAQVK